MAASTNKNIIDSSSRIIALTGNLEDFLSAEKSRSSEFTDSLKNLYDTSKSITQTSSTSDALQELIVAGFDDEQIWQQLELENDSCISDLLTGAAKILSNKADCSFKPGNAFSSKSVSRSKQDFKKSTKGVKDSKSGSENKTSKQSKQKDSLEKNKAKYQIDEDENDDDDDDDDDDDGNFGESDNEITNLENKLKKIEHDDNEHDDDDDDDDGNFGESDDEIADIENKLEKIDKDDKFFDFTGDSDDDLNFDFGPLGQKGNLDEELFKDDNEENESGKKSKNKNKKSVTFKDDGTSDKNEKVERKSSKKQAEQKFKKGSVVDDAFFKLSELEEFLNQEDRREDRRLNREQKGEGAGDDEDDVDIDMFGEVESEDEEVHYEDFFDPPDGEVDRTDTREVTKKLSSSKDYDDDEEEGSASDENSEEENRSVTAENRKTFNDRMMKFAGYDRTGETMQADKAEHGEDLSAVDKVGQGGDLSLVDKVGQGHDLFADSESEGEDVGEILGGKREQKSSYEIRQERLKKKISNIEGDMLGQKPWQMAGEITGGKRPENSLLQENLQFDHTTRLPPEITEETTKSLEDLVKQRIKDKAWDDVERKVKPKDNPFEYKKRITLDQEKSKLSLGEIYEQEYLKQQKSEETEKTDPDHDGIKKMMQSLFIKLDALSNFHYTPKQATAEIKVITNQPSISMEEVAPVSVSDGMLLAPEEIKDKLNEELKGATERTKTDKLRKRKLKKKVQRSKQQEREKREKLVEKLNPGLGNKYSKEKALKKLEKESKSDRSGVTMLKDDKKEKSGLTSSKAFFTQLQDAVVTSINKKKADKRKKSDKASGSGKKLKL